MTAVVTLRSRDDGLFRYELAIEGHVLPPFGASRWFEQNLIRELKDAGMTTIEIPDAARRKLAR